MGVRLRMLATLTSIAMVFVAMVACSNVPAEATVQTPRASAPRPLLTASPVQATQVSTDTELLPQSMGTFTLGPLLPVTKPLKWITFTGRYIWAVDDVWSIAKVEPQTGEIVQEITFCYEEIGYCFAPYELFYNSADLWVRFSDAHGYARLDAETGLPRPFVVEGTSPTETLTPAVTLLNALIRPPLGVGHVAPSQAAAFVGSRLWFPNHDSTIQSFDLAQSILEDPVTVGIRPESVIFVAPYLWVQGEFVYYAVDTESRTVVKTIDLRELDGIGPFATDGRRLWVGTRSATLLLVDAVTGAVQPYPIPLNSNANSLFFDGVALWVFTDQGYPSGFAGTVSVINPATDGVVKTIHFDEAIGGYSWDGQNMWLSVGGKLQAIYVAR